MQTVVTAFYLLEQLAERQPVGVSDFARDMSMPKSTVHRFLKSLEEAGWIRPVNGDQALWVLTARPLIVAQRVATDLGIREAAADVMERLRDDTREAVHLAVPEGNEIVVIEGVESPQAVRIYWPAGQHSPAYATANGKAILAFATAEQRASLLPKSLRRLTDHTITTKSELEAELDRTRERGWSLSMGELREDIGSVAAPILDATRRPVASLSVFFPLHRLPADGGKAFGEAVAAGAVQIERALAVDVRTSPPRRGRAPASAN